MSALAETPSQTVGPYLSIGLRRPDWVMVVPDDTAGAFWLRGVVLDGQGEPVLDALAETWQADPAGGFDHPDDPRGAREPELAGFRGFGRSETVTGEYAIRTVKPGAVPGPEGGVQAPHIDVSVFARGLLDRVVTRVYFADETAANASDPGLLSVPEERRPTLLAEPSADGYRFDIVLQGDHETVFFAI